MDAIKNCRTEVDYILPDYIPDVVGVKKCLRTTSGDTEKIKWSTNWTTEEESKGMTLVAL